VVSQRQPRQAEVVAASGASGASGAIDDECVDPAVRIAMLEGQVAALEAALARRSSELRLLQRYLCRRDLAQWARLEVGLPPLPLVAHEPAYWRETCELTYAEVPETLLDLWASIFPRTPPP
jgi:hypothetical protein